MRKILKAIAAFVIPKSFLLIKGNRKGKIALTFDDGPHPEFTPKILEILKEREVKATFFLVGNAIEQHQAIALRIIKDGHTVGIHSYTHWNFLKMGILEMKDELDKSGEVFRKFLGVEPRFFRPPQGRLTIQLLKHCASKRLVTVLWSLDSLDSNFKSKEAIVAQLKSKNSDCGEIVLFHDDNQFTLEALPAIIETFQKNGFKFVTVEEMLK